MINGIGFENFRVFKEMTYFDFAPLTILTGPNNSGKSSLLSGLNLMYHNLSQAHKGRKDTFLDNLISSKFNAGVLLELYGNLKQFICKKGKRNEFTIEFKRKIVGLKEHATVSLKVAVASNMMDGYIKEIIVKSEEKNEIIFQIYKRVEDLSKGTLTYKIRTNFLFFQNAFKRKFDYTTEYQKELLEIMELAKALNNKEDIEQLENIIKSTNRKFSTNLGWYHYKTKNGEQSIEINDDPFGLPETIMDAEYYYKLLKSRANLDWVYDFSFLWNKNDAIKDAFYNAFLAGYQLSFDESYSKLNEDILKLFSEIDWGIELAINENNFSVIEYTSENLFGKGDESDGIGLKRFTERFTNVSVTPGIFSLYPETELKINEKLISPRSQKMKSFYNRVFKPLLFEIARQSHKPVTDDLKLKISKDEKDLHEINFKDIKHSLIEEHMISMIRENIKMIEACFKEVSNIEFLQADRISRQRTYSYAQKSNDHFVSMVYAVEQQAKKEKDKIYSFLNEWIKAFGFAEQLKIKGDSDTANFKIYIVKDDEEVLLADFGFGTSQLLPILLKLIPVAYDHNGDPESPPFKEKVILIEEPEANLHPALQSKLADLFVQVCQKFNTQIIIETHSEYLIRKLQYLRAKAEISESLVSIFYFYPPDKIPPMEQQIKKITIHDDGSLSDDFGTGFFDEADKIAISIWNMNKSQKN